MGASRLKQTEERLLERANAQCGLLRYEDLLELGLTRNEIRTRRHAFRLNRVHAGVYAFGHTALRDEGRWLAALWACGPGVVLSHQSAATYHGWSLPDPEPSIHLSTERTVRSRGDLVVHRVARLDRRDYHDDGRVPVTTIPRTLVDLADVLSWPAYRALADGLPQLHVQAIRAAQGRAPKRIGRGLVLRLIEADDAHTKSEFERRFLRFVRAHGLRRPDHLNHVAAGHKADAVYTEARLVVELDGRGYHQRRGQMRADRRRDADYQLAGYRIVRLVWDDLHPDEAAATAARLSRFLAA
jgi:very-short-patch-repair endonuclease/predicted transcriptional regulator of viral defense system